MKYIFILVIFALASCDGQRGSVCDELMSQRNYQTSQDMNPINIALTDSMLRQGHCLVKTEPVEKCD